MVRLHAGVPFAATVGLLPPKRCCRLAARVCSTSNAPAQSDGAVAQLQRAASERFWTTWRRYEDVIGITAVRLAQQSVLQAESDFTVAQERRRSTQSDLSSVQNELKSVHARLDKTARGDDAYIELLMAEHEMVKQEKDYRAQLAQAEHCERKAFERFSAALRDSHEREREQGEKTKYWSLVGSIIGATVGVIGTTINNRYRMRELRSLVTTSASDSAASVAALVDQLTDAVGKQHEQSTSLLQDMQRGAGATHALQLLNDAEQFAPMQPVTVRTDGDARAAHEATMHELHACTQTVVANLSEVKAMLAAIAVHGLGQRSGTSLEAGDGEPPAAIYVGADVADLFERSSRRYEQTMRTYAIVTVAAFYLAIGACLCFVKSAAGDR